MGQKATPLLIGPLLLCTLQFNTSCFTESFANPYDLERAPVHMVKKGTIKGYVVLEHSSNYAGVDITITPVSAGLSGDTIHTATGDGAFHSHQLLPGTYNLLLSKQGYEARSLNHVGLSPGQELDIGTVVLPIVRGVAQGTVVANGAPASGGVRITFFSQDQQEQATLTVFSEASGLFRVTQLAAGTYTVIAEREGFSPARSASFEVTAEHTAENPAHAGTLQLFPAEQVLGVVDQHGNPLPHVSHTSIHVSVLRFGTPGIDALEMRLGESPSMTSQHAFVDFQPLFPFTLGADPSVPLAEGERTIYGQFRWQGQEQPLSTLFTTSVVHDASPPLVLRVELAPAAQMVNGTRYLTSNPNAVPISVWAADLFTSVDAIKLVRGGSDANQIPFTPLATAGASVTYEGLLNLGASDGVKHVDVYLRDVVGNVSSAVGTQVVLDTTPPVLLANPAVSALEAVGSQLRSSHVTLEFLVGADNSEAVDGAATMRFGALPESTTQPMVPFAPSASLNLAATHGDQVQFYGTFADQAGNQVHAESIIYTMNLLGSIAGRVSLEGVATDAPGHQGVLVEVMAAGSDTVYATTASIADGSFAIADLDPGHYRLRCSHSGFRDAIRAGIVVAAAEQSDAGQIDLVIARGHVAGYFFRANLQAGENHGGILVEVHHPLGFRRQAFSATDGAVRIDGIPERIADGRNEPGYTLTASAAGFASFRLGQLSITRDQVLTVSTVEAPVELARRVGDFEICSQPPAGNTCPAITSTRETSVYLNLNAENVTHVRMSEGTPFADPGDATDTSFVPFPDVGGQPFAVTLSEPDGRRTIYVQFKDDGGDLDPDNDTLGPVLQASVVLDRQPPSDCAALMVRHDFAGSVDTAQQEDLRIFTNHGRGKVRLALLALEDTTDGSGISSVQISPNENLSAAAQLAYGDTRDHEIDPSEALGDGRHDLYVGFCDGAGNCTPSPQAVHVPVVLDRQAPTSLNGLAFLANTEAQHVTRDPAAAPDDGVFTTYVRSTSLPVLVRVGGDPVLLPDVGAVPEVASLRISLDPNFLGRPFLAVPSDIPSGGTMHIPDVGLTATQGTQRLYFQFRDHAGNETPIGGDNPNWFDVELDTLPPSNVAIEIEDLAPDPLLGDGATNQAAVRVHLTSGDADTVCIYGDLLVDPGCQAIVTPQELQLDIDQDGIKVLFAEFVDIAGNRSAAVNTTMLVDTTAPNFGEPAVTVSHNGAGFVSTQSVEVRVRAGDARDIMLSEDPLFSVDDWQRHGELLTLQLGPGEGPHHVFACLRDAVGNRDIHCAAGAPLSGTVVHDRTAPTVTATINGGGSNEPTNDRAVTLHISVDDNLAGVAGVALANASFDCNSASYNPLPGDNTLPFTLTAGDGLRRVYLCAKDRADNVTSTAVATENAVDLDSEIPSGSLTAQENPTSNPVLTFNVSSDDANNRIAITEELGAVANCDIDTPAPPCHIVTTTMAYTLTDQSLGRHTIYFQLFDLAGNRSGVGAVNIDLVEVTVARPLPVLERITPQSITALGDTSYDLIVVGADLASDTQLRVGNFEMTADCSLQGDYAGATCTAANATGDSCGGDTDCRNCCLVQLTPTSPAWALTRNSGYHLARLVTPPPVDGTGVSSNSAFFSVVAPTPELLDFTLLEGETSAIDAGCLAGDIGACAPHLPRYSKRYITDQQAPLGAALLVWGRNLVDGAYISAGSRFGEILALVEDPSALHGIDDLQVAIARFNGLDLAPAEVPTELTVTNPPPGGGGDTLALGVNWSQRQLSIGTAEYLHYTMRMLRSDLITPWPLLFAERFRNPHDRLATSTELESSPLMFVDAMGLGYSTAKDLQGRLLYSFVGGQPGSGAPLGVELALLQNATIAGSSTVTQNGSNMGVPAGTFGAFTAYTVGTRPCELKSGDVTGDGLPDLIVLNEESSDISVLPIATLGTFGPQVRTATITRPKEMSTADFDGDGLVDALIRNNDGIGIYLSTGDGTFAPHWSDEQSWTSAALGDFSDDGIVDIVVNQGVVMQVFVGRGDGTFTAGPSVNTGSNTSGIRVADVDGDHRDDVVGWYADSQVYFGLGEGELSERCDGANVSDTTDAVLADINADGAIDLINVRHAFNRARIWLGDGAGDFTEQAEVTTEYSPRSVNVADVNADGTPDLLVGQARSVYGRSSIFFGNGDGSFGPGLHYEGPGGAYQVIDLLAQDLNNDYVLDLVALYADGGLLVAWGTSAGQRPHFSPLPTDARPRNLTSADLNCDGNPDLAVVAHPTSGWDPATYTGSANGSLTRRPEADLDYYAHSIHATDLDGDGFTDMVLPQNYVGGAAIIARLGGDGTGDLSHLGSNHVGFAYPRESALTDLNGDALPDVVAASYDNQIASVLLGVASGDLLPAVTYTVGHRPNELDVGDFNNDGHADLVLAGRYGIEVWLGDGSGDLTVHTTLNSPPFTAFGVEVIDLDRNGYDDIVVAVSNASGILIFQGLGNATFAAAVDAAVGHSCQDLAVEDFDGDAWYDLACALYSGTQVSVKRGLSATTFAPGVLYEAGSSPYELDTVDFNRDGIVDIAAVNLGDDSLTQLVPSVNVAPIQQMLTDLPLLSAAVTTGSSVHFVHQAMQDLESASLHLILQWSEPPQAGVFTYALSAPDGNQTTAQGSLNVGDVTSFPPSGTAAGYRISLLSPIVLSKHQPANPLSINALQPHGDWALTIDNGFEATAELISFTVHSRGRIYGPRVGDSAAVPEVVSLQSGTSGHLLKGRTLGYGDQADLSCATTRADRDADGHNDGPGDRFYALNLPATREVTLRVMASFDVVIELWQGGCDTQPQPSGSCAQEMGGRRSAAEISTTLDQGVDYCLVVDGLFVDAATDLVHSGDYQIFLQLSSPL